MTFNIRCYLLLLYFNIRLSGAQQVPNTSSNQANSPSSVQPRFPDLSAMGFPNFGSRRFGNPTSNYPTHSFFPFGNQYNYHQPQQGYGWGHQNQHTKQGKFQNRPIQGDYPSQQSYPYQGDSMNPNPNYQEPSYFDTPSGALMYSNHNRGNYQNKPYQGEFPEEEGYPYQGDGMNRYPNYQEPTYSNQPNDVSMYPEDSNRPYQNGRVPSNQGNFNWPMPQQGGMDSKFQYHPGSQHNSLGFQPNSNQNMRPYEMNPNQPDDLSNFPNSNIPDSLYYHHPNQYYTQTDRPNQINQNFMPGTGQPGNFQSQPINNNPNSNGNPSGSYFSKLGPVSPVGTTAIDLSSSPQNGQNLNKIPQNPAPLPKSNEISAINAGDKEAIAVKPALVTSTTASPNQR